MKTLALLITLLMITPAFATDEPKAVQCKGITKSSKVQCKRMTKDKSQLCFQHNPNHKPKTK